MIRRLQALAVEGWPRQYLAAELGIAPSHLQRVYAGRSIYPRLMERISALHDRLGMAEPGHSPATRSTRGRALSNGWLGRTAWTVETIDDPDGRPLSLRARARVEDLEWMIESGESLLGACQRLGVEPKTLLRNLERSHRADLWRRLAARMAA